MYIVSLMISRVLQKKKLYKLKTTTIFFFLSSWMNFLLLENIIIIIVINQQQIQQDFYNKINITVEPAKKEEEISKLLLYFSVFSQSLRFLLIKDRCIFKFLVFFFFFILYYNKKSTFYIFNRNGKKHYF